MFLKQTSLIILSLFLKLINLISLSVCRKSLQKSAFVSSTQDCLQSIYISKKKKEKRTFLSILYNSSGLRAEMQWFMDGFNPCQTSISNTHFESNGLHCSNPFSPENGVHLLKSFGSWACPFWMDKMELNGCSKHSRSSPKMRLILKIHRDS